MRKERRRKKEERKKKERGKRERERKRKKEEGEKRKGMIRAWKEKYYSRVKEKDHTFHLSAHFLENSAKTTFSFGCFFLCSSRQV